MLLLISFLQMKKRAQFQPQQVKSLGSHHFYHYKLEETLGNFGKLLEAM